VKQRIKLRARVLAMLAQQRYLIALADLVGSGALKPEHIELWTPGE
jgi:hypothetical protein